MPAEIRMPELSSDMTEADLVGWLVAVNDRVEVGDLIAEIETDKATVEFESPVAGVIVELCLPAPTQGVKVGELLCLIEASAEVAEGRAAEQGSGIAPQPATASTAAAAPTPTDPLAEREPASATPSHTSSDPGSTALARRIAEQRGVDLSAVVGSGAGGRVTKSDVVQAVGVDAAPPAETRASGGPAVSSSAALSRLQRAAPAAVAHFTLEARCDATAMERTRARLSADRVQRGEGELSTADFAIAALARSLRDLPEADPTRAHGALEAAPPRVDLALHVEAPAGSPAPVVVGADRLGLGALCSLRQALTERARDGSLRAEETGAAGFALVYVGDDGVDAITPTVTAPQVGVLGVGAVTRTPVVDGDAVVAGWTLRCVLALDPAAIDESGGARLLSRFRRYIEDPVEMIF